MLKLKRVLFGETVFEWCFSLYSDKQSSTKFSTSFYEVNMQLSFFAALPSSSSAPGNWRLSFTTVTNPATYKIRAVN